MTKYEQAAKGHKCMSILWDPEIRSYTTGLDLGQIQSCFQLVTLCWLNLPKAQISDLVLNFVNWSTSGADHLTGNLMGELGV